MKRSGKRHLRFSPRQKYSSRALIISSAFTLGFFIKTILFTFTGNKESKAGVKQFTECVKQQFVNERTISEPIINRVEPADKNNIFYYIAEEETVTTIPVDEK